MSFEYITEGVPIIQVPGAPALLYDKENNNLYVANGESPQWFLIGTGGSAGSSMTPSRVLHLANSSDLTARQIPSLRRRQDFLGLALTLPDAVGVGGQQITIKMIDAGPGVVTVIPNPGSSSEEFIDGGTSYTLSTQYQSVTLESDNKANGLSAVLTSSSLLTYS